MKKALVAPLNWGLGHATRCIPIINSLLNYGIDVHIASDGKALQVLSNEFPQLKSHPLCPLDITYGRHFMLSMLRQTPTFLRAIQKDHQIIRKIFKKENFDYIISDNRYGVYHPGAYNVFMTHQIQVLDPLWVTPISKRMTRLYTRGFDEVWVPDFNRKDNLTGKMSEPSIKKPKKYIGVLSRFKNLAPGNESYQMAFILSGPEPSRTIFEHLILSQLKELDSNPKTILVRGLPGETGKLESGISNLTIAQYMNASELNQVLIDSETIICRSGYTSVMDLLALGKKAILVPTPRQVEQEYLGLRLAANKLFMYSDQAHFHIDMIQESPAFNRPDFPMVKEFDVASFLPDIRELSQKKDQIARPSAIVH